MYSLQIQRAISKTRPPTLQAETETGTQIYCEQLAVLSHIDSHKVRWVFQRITLISPTKMNFTKLSSTAPPHIDFEQLAVISHILSHIDSHKIWWVQIFTEESHGTLAVLQLF